MEQSNQSAQHTQTQRGPLRSALRIMCTVLSALTALVACSPIVPWHWYITDVVSNFALHAAGIAICLAVVSALLKARCAALLAIIGTTVPVLIVVTTPRAAWTSSEPHFSVLVFNTQSVGGDQSRALETILATDVDVVALPELSPELITLIETDPRVRAQYPHFWTNNKKVRGQLLLLSRWPASELLGRVGPEGLDMTPAVIVHAMRIEAPAGPIGVLLIHPLAPKNIDHWRNGNSAVHRAIDVINEAKHLHIPLLLAADINATPTSWRSRTITHRTGLRRAKPFLRSTGTWPANLLWPCQLAIDDVWVSSDVSITSWQTLEQSGSDHLPVRVTITYAASDQSNNKPQSGN